LSPKAREVYASLAAPGTEADVAARTGINPKTVGARIGQELIKKGLVEVIDKLAPEGGGRKVSVYAQVPPERVAELKAKEEHRLRVKPPRKRPLDQRIRMAHELFKDKDLLQALAAETAREQAANRARKAARDELRARERQAAELRRHEKRAADAEDPRLPFWRAQRTFTQGADAARILKMMLDRDVQLERVRGEPLMGADNWVDAVRHTTDMLEVSGALHQALHDAFGLPCSRCPACGMEAPPPEDDYEVIDAEALDDLAELVSGDR
jgi:hypothetical protein